jgi:hypothetical protein
MGIMSAIGTFFGVLFVFLFAVAVTHLLLLELSSNEALGHEFGEGVHQFWITPTVPLADAASVGWGLAVAHQNLAHRRWCPGCGPVALRPR